MRLGILFSGGKDSCFALYKSMQEHDIRCLITISSSNPDSFMFHTPNIKFAKDQAKAIGLPIIIKETKGEKEKELEDLKKAIKQAKEKYDLQGIVSGAIESSYQKDRIDQICKELYLESLAPLWHIDPEKYLNELVKEGFKVIITSVSAEGMTKEFLGKEINAEMIEKLKQLNKKYGVHIALEGGEAETFCIDGPVFKKKLEITDYEISYKNHCGIFRIKKLKLIEE